ncbi:lebercilin [Patella vulgata]|uniref:lebercilin n=1 Tax=Patella vulgata TaxID=6465 RepID=UPI00217F72B9|nr:lebercilin [Patella vulgata]
MADRSDYSEDDDCSRYSDDFVSEDDIVSIKQPTKSQPPKKSSPYTIKTRGRGRGRGRGRTSQSMKQDVHRSGNSSVAMRMMSASRIKQNEFRNQLEEQKAQIQQLLSENKTLKKMQFRHEKALGKFEEKESELPQLLTKHSNEVRALREQNRRMKEKYEKADRYLRDAEDDLDVYKVRLKKYKKLCESKGLPERDELNRKLQQAEIDLEEKDSKIKELERHIEKLNKNHRHELGIEMAHHRETKKHLREMEDKQNHVKEMLRVITKKI